MQDKLLKRFVTEERVIDYGNKVFCHYTLVDDKVVYYHFSQNKVKLTYVTKKQLKELQNTTFDEHYKIITESSKKITDGVLKTFNDFDNLICVGGSSDGMLKDRFGQVLALPIRIDTIFSSCYLNLETSKKECQNVLDSLNPLCFKDAQIVEIPWYNQNEDLDEHYTINLTIIPTQEQYETALGNKTYLDDYCKVKLFNLIKIK